MGDVLQFKRIKRNQSATLSKADSKIDIHATVTVNAFVFRMLLDSLAKANECLELLQGRYYQ